MDGALYGRWTAEQLNSESRGPSDRWRHRDELAGCHPYDFGVTDDAEPNQVLPVRLGVTGLVTAGRPQLRR